MDPIKSTALCLIKTEKDMEIKQCLETWLKHDNISVHSIIKVDFMDNGHLTSEEIKCAKTFISDLKEDLMCSEKYFMCGDKYIDSTKSEPKAHVALARG